MNTLETRRRLLLGSVPHEYILTKEGVPPLSFYSNGKQLLSYEIAGNTVQDGAPAPDNPVEVMGVGEKTGNLFNVNTHFSLNGTGDNRTVYTLPRKTGGLVKIKPNTEYTLSGVNVFGDTYMRIGLFDTSPFVGTQTTRFFSYNVTRQNKVTFTATNTECYALIYTATIFSDESDNDIMLNEGSEPLPYEPYGYKIPVTCGGATENIYLDAPLMQGEILKSAGERQIKWHEHIVNLEYIESSQYNTKYAVSSLEATFPASTIYSERNSAKCNKTSYGELSVPNTFYMNARNVVFVGSMNDTLETMKAKYDGAKVVYILATPTTETVTTPEIPTLKGTNILTVDTEVQPSNVRIEYRSGRKG